MGRRRKNKSTPRMAKKKFIQRFCKQCNLCDGKPKFCYKLYSASPKVFERTIFPKIQDQEHFFMAEFKESKPSQPAEGGILMMAFRALFCSHNICRGCSKADKADDNRTAKCLNELRSQCSGRNKNGYMSISQIRRQNKKQRKKEKKAKQKAIPATVTVIMSENQAFREAVERILGNNNNEQNKTGESAGAVEGCAGKST